MRLQDYIAENTITSADQLIRQVERLGEKATWQPLDEGRTALDQLAECALITGSMPQILGAYKFPDLTADDFAEFEKNKAALDTVEKAATKLRESAQAAASAIRNIPDEKLSERMKFWGEEPWLIADVAAYPGWNHTYHVGQVCYVQTLAGDKEVEM